MSRFSHQQVQKALDEIINRGGANLYDKYITQKVPGDCNEKIFSSIQSKFAVMQLARPQKQKISGDPMPRALSAPMKIPITTKNPNSPKIKQTPLPIPTDQQKFPIQPKSSALILHPQQKKASTSTSSSCFFNSRLPRSKKPTNCIKNSCRKGQIDYNEMQVRRQKILSDSLKKIQKQFQGYHAAVNKQKDEKRRNLESVVKELVGDCVPYAYGHDGELIIPDVKEFKKNLQQSMKIQFQAKPLTLSYKALDVFSSESSISPGFELLGRKKGYSTPNRIERAKKINEVQFTNNHQRQASAIPFINIQSGIKLTQKDNNRIAQRRNTLHISLKQYQSQKIKQKFKSSIPISIVYSSSNRPVTHSYSRKSVNNNNNNNFKSVGRHSESEVNMIARPKSCREFNRVRICNRELAVDLVRKDVQEGL